MSWYQVLSAQEASVGPTGVVPLPGYQGPPIAKQTPAAITSGSQLDKTAVTGIQPLGPPIEGYFAGETLSSGSGINRAIIGAPWPKIIDGATKFFNAWRRNAFHDWFKVSVPANYGFHSSRANFGFNDPEYEPGEVVQYSQKGVPTRSGVLTNFTGPRFVPLAPSQAVVGLYPGPVPNADRPMWDVLTPIAWRLMVLNPAELQYFESSANYTQTVSVPAEYPVGAAAALNRSGAPLL